MPLRRTEILERKKKNTQTKPLHTTNVASIKSDFWFDCLWYIFSNVLKASKLPGSASTNNTKTKAHGLDVFLQSFSITMSPFHVTLVSRALRKQKQFSKIGKIHLLLVLSRILHRTFETPEIIIRETCGQLWIVEFLNSRGFGHNLCTN